MAHTHDVHDTGKRFEINGISRFIKETSETKLVLVQGDHKSEVVTFEMPRYIDGHDMLLCNKIRVHYINIDTKTSDSSADIYEVTDLKLCEDCGEEETLLFTWTIEAQATKYFGSLAFLIKFECTEGENILYQWNTAKYVGVNVLAGIDNSEEFVEKYSNVLEEWYNELTNGADSIEELNQKAIAEIEVAKEDAKEDIQGKANSTMAAMDQFSTNTYNSFKNNVDGKMESMTQHAEDTYNDFNVNVNKKATETLATIPEEYTDVDADVKTLKENELYPSDLNRVKLLNWEHGKIHPTNGNKRDDSQSIRTSKAVKLKVGTVVKSPADDIRCRLYKYPTEEIAYGAIVNRNEVNGIYTITEEDAQYYTITEEDAQYYIAFVITDYGSHGFVEIDEFLDGFDLYYPPKHKKLLQENLERKFFTPDHVLGVQVGRNRFPNYEFTETTRYQNVAGTIVMDALSPYFHLEGGTYYGNGFTQIKLHQYDENFVKIGELFIYAGKNKPNVFPDGVEWVRAYFDKSKINEIQITKDEYPSDYRPYEVIFPKTIDWDSTEPSEDFRAEIEDTVDEVLNLSDIGMVRFLHVTDTHIGTKLEKNHAMCFKSMIEVANRIGADFILHTGDVLTGGNGDVDAQKSALLQMTEIFSDCNIPVIVSRGNHDDNSIAGLTEENIVFNSWWNNHMNKAINNQSRHFVFPENDNGYFYYDIPEKRIRVVNINSSDLTDEERLSTGGQNFAKISQAQLEWLDTEALIVNDNWKIICVSHISCASSQPNMEISNASDLYNLLTKYKGNIIAYIYGHTHVNANYVDSSTGIRFISACTCGGSVVNYLQNGRNTSYASAEAKKTSPTGEMLFDVCILGYDDNISKVRWGVHDDVQGN